MRKEIKPLRILIIEDNPGDQLLLEKNLARTKVPVKGLLYATQLSEVKTVLNDQEVDVAFLDLSLPDSTGIESFVTLQSLLPHTPIIVLSGWFDLEVATETIALGAQDYLMKGEFDEKLLAKSIQYSIERQKNQYRLEEIIERFEIVNQATRDIIWDWNLQKREIYVNTKLQEIFGYSQENISTDWVLERLHPGERERVQSYLTHAIKNKVSNWEGEFRFLAADGQYRYAFAKGYILFNPEGFAFRMIGSVSDITEKRNLEQQLVAQQLTHQKLITENTIQAQEKEREELGKELHDNINQILATVKMFLDIAKVNEGMRMDLVDRSHQNVSYAIEEIRKLSKTLVAPSLGDIGLFVALDELIDEINITKDIQVELDYLENRDKKLSASMELMLYRIVQEQLNNIIKYAKASHVVVSLQTEPSQLILSVSDNGIGFDPSTRAKGIGLRNIASRVEFHEGLLEIISSPGQGCELKVTIPLIDN